MYYLLYWAVVLTLMAWKWCVHTPWPAGRLPGGCLPACLPGCSRLGSRCRAACLRVSMRHAPLAQAHSTALPSPPPAALYCRHTGTLTDRREAQVGDLKSFAHHVGQRLDEEAGLAKGKGSDGSPGSSSMELERGEGDKPALPGLPKVESAFIAPGAGPDSARRAEDAGNLPRSSPGGDSADSYERQASAAVPTPPADAV